MADGYQRIEIRLHPPFAESNVELVTTALFELGCAGLEEREDQEGGTYLIIAGFSDADPPAPDDLEEVFEAANVRASVVRAAFEPVDWSTHWRRHMKPMQFGDLWIVPTWIEVPEGAKHVLLIDPSTAFGTGQHETTALCLEAIGRHVHVDRLLDVGTGTGVLALAALRMGVKRAVGTDNDPEALRVALENAEANGLSSSLRLCDSEPETLGTFPLVVANILAGPLIEMAPRLCRAVAPLGVLLLSGILFDQAEEVKRAYEACGLTCTNLTRRNEWARLDFARLVLTTDTV